MKLARDGHLDPLPGRKRIWIVPLHEVVEVLPNGNVITALGDGPDHIEWGPRHG